MAISEQSKRPSAVTLKTVLDRSKESKSVSPYKEKDVEPIKVEQAPAPQPEPVQTEPVVEEAVDQQGPKTPVKQPEKSLKPTTYEIKAKPDFTKPYQMPKFDNKMVEELIDAAVERTVNQKYSGKFIPAKPKRYSIWY